MNTIEVVSEVHEVTKASAEQRAVIFTEAPAWSALR